MYLRSRIYYCLFALLLSSSTFLGASVDRQARIAIIGGGAAGLTAAYTLEKAGFSQVTVFEKEDQLGGKVHSFQLDGMVYEVGAFWAGSSYEVVDELATKFGVEFQIEEAVFQVRLADGQKFALATYPLKVFNIWELTTGYYHWLRVQKKFAALSEVGGFFQLDHPDLFLPFEEFIAKYQIEVFAQIFRPFWIGCGYGYYEDTPALYVLKLMLESLDLSLGDVLKSFLPWSGQSENSLRRAPEGFQELFVRLGESLRDVRLQSEVTQVRRLTKLDHTVIEVTANGVIDEFDYVIIATDLQAARQYLDVNMEESQLFSMVKNYNYYIHLVAAELTENPGTMIFLDEYGRKESIGHMTALINRQAAPMIWTTGQLFPWQANEDDLFSYLNHDFAALGGAIHQVIDRWQWTYFPHVLNDDLRAGFYPRLAALQGKNRTFYIGGILNFETVEGTAAFAKNLIEDQFL
ncbi:MAG: FAD-dependent oxidoreductase [Oligoflexus sp.]